MDELASMANDLFTAVMANPGIILGAIVALVLLALSADFRKTVLTLIDQAIFTAEGALTTLGREKLDIAVDLVLKFIPQPYRAMLPRMVVVSMVQFVFNRKWAFALDRSKKVEVLKQPLDPMNMAPPAPDSTMLSSEEDYFPKS